MVTREGEAPVMPVEAFDAYPGAGEKKEIRVQYSIEAPAELSAGGLE